MAVVQSYEAQKESPQNLYLYASLVAVTHVFGLGCDQLGFPVR